MRRSAVAVRRRLRLVGAIASLAVLVDFPSFAADNAPASAQVRVVHVADYPPDLAQKERAALLQAFASLGYVEGRNLELTTYDVGTALAAEPRNPAKPSPGDRFGPNPYAVFFATSIPQMRPQVVLASGGRAVAAARESGLGIPVVFWRVSDPVGLGHVATLARPGGNLTGFSAATEKLAPKRLELVHELVPNARKVGFVFIEDFPSHVRQAAEVKAAAARIGVKTQDYALPLARWEAAELDALFATMRRDGIEAFLLPDTNVKPSVLAELAARHRLPTIYALTSMVTNFGGLAAYSTEATRVEDVVGYAVRILRGERPADLPVQESTRFEFVLNARAARALGLTFPQTFLLRANQVVEK
jgi:putative ABC transport system substrate-binding protein